MQPTVDSAKIANAVIANAIINPPAAYPQITVGGSPFELRFSLTSSFFLETKCSIPAQELTQWLADQVAARKYTSVAIIMTGAMLGHQKGEDWVPTPMTAEEFLRVAKREEIDVISEMYAEAISKAAAAVVRALTPPTPEISEPIPTPIN